MDYLDIEMKLREILIELELIDQEQEINSQTNIRHGLNIDEFQIIEVTGALEEEFDISIDTDEAEQTETVGQFVELIQRNINEK